MLGNILGGGITSRLHQALVEKSLALSVTVVPWQLRDPALFSVFAPVRPGVEPSEVEAVVRQEIARVASGSVTEAECEKARTQIEAEVIFDRDSTDQIAASLSEAIAVADWEWYADYPKAIHAVTPADVQRVVLEYLHDDALTVGLYLPKTAGAAGGSGRGRRRAVVTAAVRRPFAEAVHTRTLSNGARLFVLENRFNPTLALSGSLQAGRLFAPPDRRLIASVAAGELMKGTARRTKLQLAEDLEGRAASLSFSSDASDPVGVDIGGSALSRDADLLLDALVEVLCTPAFPAEELDKEKKRLIGAIRQQQEQTSARAYEAAMRRIYPPGHPLLPPHRGGADRPGGGARPRGPRGVLPGALRGGFARARARRRRGGRARPRPARGGALGLARGADARAGAAAGTGAGAGLRDRRSARQGERGRGAGTAGGPDAHGPGLPSVLARQLRPRPVLADLAPRRAGARHGRPHLRHPLGHFPPRTWPGPSPST